MNKIMIIGTFHMQAKNDINNFSQEDMLKNSKHELKELVDKLSKFKPTRIAVEYRKTNQEILNNEFEKYIALGSDSLDEVDQIAFPIAKKLGHKKVHAIDWMEMGAVQHGCGEVIDYLHLNQPRLEKEINGFETEPVDLEKETINQAFQRLNSKENVDKTVAYYMNYARIGSEEYYGNGWLIWWYQRNLNIFTNICSLVEESNDERILLLIGAAHKGILEQFFKNIMKFEIVDVLNYL